MHDLIRDNILFPEFETFAVRRRKGYIPPIRSKMDAIFACGQMQVFDGIDLRRHRYRVIDPYVYTIFDTDIAGIRCMDNDPNMIIRIIFGMGRWTFSIPSIYSD